MPVNKKNTDDMEYLAHLGFKEIGINDADLKELASKIRARTFSYNNGLYFGFISLLVGIFIGLSFFFMIYNQPVIYASKQAISFLNDSTAVKKNAATEILLDTLIVLRENFVHPRAYTKTITDTAAAIAFNAISDSVSIIPAKPVDASLVLDKPMSEAKLKYIDNAPVIYIHNLKVTDYTALYFKKNQYVKLGAKDGLPVIYANKDEYNKNKTGLKQSADYYLHEELADALLAFKQGKYDQSLFALNTISSYNSNGDINCDFYSAMCYYYKKNYLKAMDYFERCINNANNSFLQEAGYYDAVVLYESGDKQAALQKFKLIADEGEFYAEKAKVF